MRFVPFVAVTFLVLAVATPSPLRAQDGGVTSNTPTVTIGVLGSVNPCPAPCRETNARRDAVLTLSATATDPNGDTLTLLWELETRPAGSMAQITGATVDTASFTADAEGIFDVGILVTDPAGNTARGEVRVVVANAPFTPALVMRVDGRTVICDPRCPSDAILIGSELEGDATGTTHDPGHGQLRFTWSLVAPPGSTADLSEPDNGKVVLRPDVDGAYEIRVTLADDQDIADQFVSFVIPNALAWKPLDGFNCQAAASPPAFAFWAVALLALRRRKTRR